MGHGLDLDEVAEVYRNIEGRTDTRVIRVTNPNFCKNGGLTKGGGEPRSGGIESGETHGNGVRTGE